MLDHVDLGRETSSILKGNLACAPSFVEWLDEELESREAGGFPHAPDDADMVGAL